MSQTLSEWLNNFTDPYAILGVSVAADDRRVQKRYRSVAMLLHPDKYVQADAGTKQFASQMLARIVNPAYEKLKQEKERAESLALLRVQVRRSIANAPLNPTTSLARQLIQQPISGVEIFYEQAIDQLAVFQYQPLEQFEATTRQLVELNLVYLQLKMGEIFREKPRGLVPVPPAATTVPAAAPIANLSTDLPVTESYAQRHYRRAQEYMRKNNWNQAVPELKDAIKIEATKSEYHALLGVAYFRQNLPAMARVHLRQALKLNPQDPIACKFAAEIGIKDVSASNGQQNGKAQGHQRTKTDQKNKTDKDGGLFGLFRSKK